MTYVLPGKITPIFVQGLNHFGCLDPPTQAVQFSCIWRFASGGGRSSAEQTGGVLPIHGINFVLIIRLHNIADTRGIIAQHCLRWRVVSGFVLCRWLFARRRYFTGIRFGHICFIPANLKASFVYKLFIPRVTVCKYCSAKQCCHSRAKRPKRTTLFKSQL